MINLKQQELKTRPSLGFFIFVAAVCSLGLACQMAPSSSPETVAPSPVQATGNAGPGGTSTEMPEKTTEKTVLEKSANDETTALNQQENGDDNREELGTRVRHKKSKRGVASVIEN